MAIWNRKQIEKAAPVLPAGSQVTRFSPEELAGIASQMYNVGIYNPLPRNPFLPATPFGPSNPLNPSAINATNDDGRTEPRRWEYPVAWNILVSEQRLVPWSVLRLAADQIDILRRCVEVSKSKVTGLKWDFVFDETASVMVAATGGKDHVRAMQEARDKFGPEIARMRDFWTMPDRINGLSFKDWLSMALEEVLVLDALAIYPHPDMKGDLHSFEILDGSTIKPLLDDRGMRPQHPFPAYQQVLYGFPRGEFLASSDDPDEDGNYNSDELVYAVRNRRTHTPYGYSPVERALPIADIYLKRQQWLRAEFTDGVIPDIMFMPDGSFGATPELIKAYEAILNDDLAGQTEQRKRARILPPGLTPVDNSGHSEKFSATFDEYLIKGVTGHFGVLPTEIGYADGGTLGGAGQQMGEAQASKMLGAAPLNEWIEDLISNISYNFLGCPRELRFSFDVGGTQDTSDDAKRRQTEIDSGQRTLNEARAEIGLPLLDTPEADAPMLKAAGALYFVTPDGITSPSAGATTSSNPEGESHGEQIAGEPKPEEKPEEKPAKEEQDSTQEVKAFLKWAKKGNTERDFEFLTLDAVHAASLNRAAKNGDTEFIKAISDVVLKKA